jgi:hypothetical protein
MATTMIVAASVAIDLAFSDSIWIVLLPSLGAPL